MKEFTYTHLDDYLRMATNYSEPKTIKIYHSLCRVNGQGTTKYHLRAYTYLRTAMIKWEGAPLGVSSGETRDSIEMLVACGHAPGKVEDITPPKL